MQQSPVLKMTAYFTTGRVAVLFYQTGSQLCAVKSLPGHAVTFWRRTDLSSLLYRYKIQSAIMCVINKYVRVGLNFTPFARRQLNSAWTSNILPTAA